MKNKFEMKPSAVDAFLKEHQNKLLDGTAGVNAIVIDLNTIHKFYNNLTLKLVSEGLVAVA
ncbi:MAG: hypothetical protein HQ528_11415 [Candidatus Marinimicrobia bacterium]|nr:hypothetical protein [Candidatus Neomarinimicrobiota bacterium]